MDCSLFQNDVIPVFARDTRFVFPFPTGFQSRVKENNLMKLNVAVVKSKTDKADEIKSLDFSKSKISKVEDISFCLSLRKLNLSNNSIKSSESVTSLRHLSSLTWLDLSNNQLEEIDGICRIQSLNVLNVSKNEISIISTRIVTMNQLQALIATDNRIKTLPPLPSNLDTIVVSRNKIEDFGNVLAGLEFLKKLSASHNALLVFPNISNCHSLKEVRLNDNKIFTIGQTDLPGGIEIIDVGRNCLAQVKSLAAILCLRRLKSLNISNNPLCSEECYEIVKSQLPILQILDNRTLREQPKSGKK